ncbi:MAG: hypothetical protein N2444_10925 [Methylocystis sp.]|nr:hypothetical protein [Methylocystis sp.]
MKTKITLFAAFAVTSASLPIEAGLAAPMGPAFKAPGIGVEYAEARMYWRCGKNNPAMWGTFGNGCLKQKRKARSS